MLTLHRMHQSEKRFNYVGADQDNRIIKGVGL
jgi:hypothetical protein